MGAGITLIAPLVVLAIALWALTMAWLDMPAADEADEADVWEDAA